MARKFVSFNDYSSQKKGGEIDESADIAQAKFEVRNKMSELKAKIREMKDVGDELGAQLLELDLKIQQLKLQETDLKSQKDHLKKVKEVSDNAAKDDESKEKEK